MATATRTPRHSHHVDPVVLNPLDRLEGVIRRYVPDRRSTVGVPVRDRVVRGGAVARLRHLPRRSPGIGLSMPASGSGYSHWRSSAIALVGILALRIGRRLTTEFSYPSLAMVLERRFPDILGDRLITAVELANIPESRPLRLFCRDDRTDDLRGAPAHRRRARARCLSTGIACG